MNLKKYFINIKKFDWITLLVVIFFTLLGLMAIYGISLGSGDFTLSNLKKQIFFAGIGLIIIFILSFFDYKLLRTYGTYIYALSLSFLATVLFLGKEIRGTKGWFALGSFHFQPVEMAKICLIIILAKYFCHQFYEQKKFSQIIISGLIASASIILTLLQPDLGSAAVLFLIWAGMLLLFGVKKSHSLIIVSFFFTTFIISWFFVLKPYQKDRIYTFLNPQSDPLGKGYNINQSIIAVGSGQFKGKGLGSGTQTQLKFLPETKTDFIFSVIAEELGFILVTLIFAGWTLIFFRIGRLAKKANNEFAMFVSSGIAIFFLIHVFVNIGVSIGILPATGLPLPFMSYGGSFLLSCFAAIGILQSIAAQSEKTYFKDTLKADLF